MADSPPIKTLTADQFRRFGIALCYRLGCDRRDKRLAKILKKLERSVGPPANEKLRRDALNAAKSVYNDLYSLNDVMKSIACTLVCACWDGPNSTLIGNFEDALDKSESLGRSEIRKIEHDLLQEVLAG
jgi:hypothetical protein